MVVAPQVVRDLKFSHGLAQIAIAGRGWFYRLRNGRTASVLTFDAGPDPFQERLARQNINGHIVYIDRHLRPRLATRYDWAAPFDHGLADVCIGCREAAADFVTSKWNASTPRLARLLPKNSLATQALSP